MVLHYKKKEWINGYMIMSHALWWFIWLIEKGQFLKLKESPQITGLIIGESRRGPKGHAAPLPPANGHVHVPYYNYVFSFYALENGYKCPQPSPQQFFFFLGGAYVFACHHRGL